MVVLVFIGAVTLILFAAAALLLAGLWFACLSYYHWSRADMVGFRVAVGRGNAFTVCGIVIIAVMYSLLAAAAYLFGK